VWEYGAARCMRGTIAIWMCFRKSLARPEEVGHGEATLLACFSFFMADAKQAAYEIRKRSAKETQFKESIFAHSQL
jgi:hypothetical protein